MWSFLYGFIPIRRARVFTSVAGRLAFGLVGARDMMLVGNRRLAGCTGFVTTKPYFEQDHFREAAQMVKSHIVISR